MGILLRTLFEPWKQITSYSGPNDSLDVKFHVWFDNLFARSIGFVIRSFVILFGSLAIILVVIFGTVLALLWPLVPFIPLVLIILTVVQL